jgi:hypothetical protein
LAYSPKFSYRGSNFGTEHKSALVVLISLESLVVSLRLGGGGGSVLLTTTELGRGGIGPLGEVGPFGEVTPSSCELAPLYL